MPTKTTDPTDPIRRKALRYAGVDAGTSCTQTSFKVGKTAFLYLGMQGGRYKAMFKLGASMAEAKKLAKQAPDRFQHGSTAWVTARFTADEPMPNRLWEKWLEESYGLSQGPAGKGKTKKAVSKKVSSKKQTTKKRKTTKKATTKKKTNRRR